MGGSVFFSPPVTVAGKHGPLFYSRNPIKLNERLEVFLCLRGIG